MDKLLTGGRAPAARIPIDSRRDPGEVVGRALQTGVGSLVQARLEAEVAKQRRESGRED